MKKARRRRFHRRRRVPGPVIMTERHGDPAAVTGEALERGERGGARVRLHQHDPSQLLQHELRGGAVQPPVRGAADEQVID